MKKRWITLLAAAAVGAALLTGCGSGGAQKEEAAAVSASSEAAETASAVSASSEAESAGEAEEASEVESASAAEESVSAAEESVSAAEEDAQAESEAVEVSDASLEDGEYFADFETDSSMFHVNEANDGKGILTVQDGKMTIHISLVSQNIVNLYPGTAEDAQKDGAELLEPTVDNVLYSDGTSDEVYGFDLPVPALEEEFDCAIIGTKGKWYDHKVSVSNPELIED